MRVVRVLLVLLLVVALAGATYMSLRGFDWLGTSSAARTRPVPSGHQEVAFLLPAATNDGWERLIAALDVLERDWATFHPDSPRLRVNKDRAFIELTADVPEFSLWLEGHENAKLWVRWYKLSSEVDAGQWVQELSRRQPAPLAILGGDTSDRALVLARALEKQRSNWRGPDPVFLITTATADHYEDSSRPGRELPKLIEVYKGRSFRFSFTNTRMAEVVLDFVRTHPELWFSGADDLVVPAGLAGLATPESVWSSLAGLVEVQSATPRVLHPQVWSDERYSTDLAKRFEIVFSKMFPHGLKSNPAPIGYGIGDFYHPNPQEVFAVTWLLEGNPIGRDQRQLLLLPTGSDRARRYLRTLVRRAPLDIRNLVVISGDSITINTIYRDRDIAWNVLDLPLPLVLFTHRNPVSQTVGFRPAEGTRVPASTTGTDVLQLNRDILEALVLAGFRERKVSWETEQVRGRLEKIRWQKGHVIGVPSDAKGPQATEGNALFDTLGNRKDRTGEHVIWLQPTIEGNAPRPKATISVWRLRQDLPLENAWQRIESMPVLYESSGAR
jgi:hypothetical protein